MEMPTVSILTPCFNSGDFLRTCLQSVRDQDYPHIEHIVQDAASTDGTAEILTEFAEVIDALSEPDKGQADGLDRALKRSRGEIILVLNADDYLLPGAVTWAVEQLARHPETACVYGDQMNVDTLGRDLYMTRGPDPYDFARIFCVEDIIPAQAAFIRRSALQAVGFYVDTTLKTCPDYEWWVRLGLQFDCVYEPRLVAAYRMHPGSETQQASMTISMVEAKCSVVTRVCDDPQTPAEVVALRQRALAGITNWGAWSLLGQRQLRSFLVESWRAYRMSPQVIRLLRLPLGIVEYSLMSWPALGRPILQLGHRLRSSLTR